MVVEAIPTSRRVPPVIRWERRVATGRREPPFICLIVGHAQRNWRRVTTRGAERRERSEELRNAGPVQPGGPWGNTIESRPGGSRPSVGACRFDIACYTERRHSLAPATDAAHVCLHEHTHETTVGLLHFRSTCLDAAEALCKGLSARRQPEDPGRSRQRAHPAVHHDTLSAASNRRHNSSGSSKPTEIRIRYRETPQDSAHSSSP
jgi:hypothetical protein